MLTIHKRSKATDGYYKFSEVGNAVTETYANYLPVVYCALILTDAVEKSLLNIHEQSNFQIFSLACEMCILLKIHLFKNKQHRTVKTGYYQVFIDWVRFFAV